MDMSTYMYTHTHTHTSTGDFLVHVHVCMIYVGSLRFAPIIASC